MEKLGRTPELTADSLLQEAHQLIESETDPITRSAMYVTSMEAGNPEYAQNNYGLHAIFRARQPENELEWDAHGYNKLGICALDNETAIVQAYADLASQGHDVDAAASKLLKYYRSGAYEDGFIQRKAISLLEAGITGENDELLNLHNRTSFRPTSGMSERSQWHIIENFLEALPKAGVDVLDKNTPYNYMAERIWQSEGKDPKYYGLTYYLAKSYAEIGNAGRATDLVESMAEKPNRNNTSIWLALAKNSPDAQVSYNALQQAKKSVEISNHYSHHYIDIKLSGTSTENLELADYYATIGDADMARKELAEPRYGRELQAGVHGKLYALTGDYADKYACIEGWVSNSSMPSENTQIFKDMVLKDVELNRRTHDTGLPEVAQEFMDEKYGDLGKDHNRFAAVAAETLAEIRDTEGTKVVLGNLHQASPHDYVRGLTAVAMGLQSAKAQEVRV